MTHLVTLSESTTHWFRWDVILFNPDTGRMMPLPVKVALSRYTSRQEYLKAKILAAKRYTIERNLIFDPSWAITPYDSHAQEIERLSQEIDQDLYNEGYRLFQDNEPATDPRLWHPLHLKGYADGFKEIEHCYQLLEAQP